MNHEIHCTEHVIVGFQPLSTPRVKQDKIHMDKILSIQILSIFSITIFFYDKKGLFPSIATSRPSNTIVKKRKIKL